MNTTASSTIFRMADRPQKALENAELTPLLISPFILTRWLAKIYLKEIWRTRQLQKGLYRRLYSSSFQTMLNQTAVIDSKGESFELDLNLQDVNHNIEVEIRPGKYKERACYWTLSTDDWIRWQLASAVELVFFFVRYSCAIRVSKEAKLSRAIEGRDERVWSVCYVHLNEAFARLYWPLLFHGRSFLFSCARARTRSPLGFLSVLDSGLFQILFEIHSNNLLFSGRGWIFY